MNHPLEDSQLEAFVRGDLSPEESAAVAQAAAADPAVQAKIEDIQSFQRLLAHRPTLPSEAIPPQQRESMRRSAARSEVVRAFKEKAQAWFIPTAAAAVLGITTLILVRMPSDAPPATAATPAPAAAEPEAAEPPPPAIFAQRGSIRPSAFPVLDLPIYTGSDSLPEISSAIEEGELPARESVRPEEILNHFPLRLNGVTSLARAADARHLATLSTETLPCPWKPSATLLIISLKGNPAGDCEIQLAFHPNPDTVFRYRLLGFPLAAGAEAGPLPTTLPASTTAILAIEIEPSKPTGELGRLKWTADGTPAPEISILRRPSVEPSDDARFAALTCSFSQWLTGEHAGVIDGEIIAALAREIASATLPPERAAFLGLIERALQIHSP
jgi:hypothetical protein